MPNPSRRDRHFFLFVALSLTVHAGIAALLNWWPRNVELPLPSVPIYVDIRELTKPQIRGAQPSTMTPQRPALPVKHPESGPQIVPRANSEVTTVADSLGNIVQPPLPQPPSAQDSQTADQPLPRLSRDQLYASLDRAVHNVVAQWQEKHREEVSQGDAVWFDMEKDLLASFFRRFRDGIYLVWDYPSAAVQHGVEGTTLLRIDINRAGLVEETRVIESSGSQLLDETARDAVFKASPHFGYLPSSYPLETLTIYAFFTYQLGSRPTIYGGR